MSTPADAPYKLRQRALRKPRGEVRRIGNLRADSDTISRMAKWIRHYERDKTTA